MKDKRPIRAYRASDTKTLHPYSIADETAFMALKAGELVELTIKQRRSLPQLQAYWVMLDKVVEATEAYPTAEKLHEAVKLALGFVTPLRMLNGDIFYVPDSVAFNKMSAPDFREYFAKAEKLIAEQFGIDVQELRKAA